MTSQEMLVVKNPPASAGDVRDLGFNSWVGKIPGGGHGDSLQYSCLEKPAHRGAWRVAAHWVAESWKWLSNLAACTHGLYCLSG